MARRLPDLADLATARDWAWSADTALYGYGLLRWRDHRDVLTLTAPADTYEPDAVRLTLANDPPVIRYRHCAVATVGTGDQRHQVVLRRYPEVTSGRRWDQLTLLTRPHRAAPPQRTLNYELTCRNVVEQWPESQFALDATIDAVTVARTLGHDTFLQLCEPIPPALLERARASLSDLANRSDPRLPALVAPTDSLELREAARRLHQAMRDRRLTR